MPTLNGSWGHYTPSSKQYWNETVSGLAVNVSMTWQNKTRNCSHLKWWCCMKVLIGLWVFHSGLLRMECFWEHMEQSSWWN